MSLCLLFHLPFETRKNQHQLLLQEDVLISCCRVSTYVHPHIFPSSATSEGMLYRSYDGFSCTNVLRRICAQGAPPWMKTRFQKRLVPFFQRRSQYSHVMNVFGIPTSAQETSSTCFFVPSPTLKDRYATTEEVGKASSIKCNIRYIFPANQPIVQIRSSCNVVDSVDGVKALVLLPCKCDIPSHTWLRS